MNILLAPNSMKGSLNAFDFADIIESAFIQSGLECTIRKVPVADGGDFTGKILSQVLNAISIELTVKGPLDDFVNATYWISGKTAIIEMAEASGMKLVKPERLNPLESSSFGTGQLILDAIQKGCTEIWLTIGGSATVDGGTGMMEALGFRFFDVAGNVLNGNGENLMKIASFQKVNIPDEISFKIICDVSNPLLGENGAAAVFGPQKGATNEMVYTLEEGLKNWNKILYREAGKKFSDQPGSGAAGGIAIPLLAFYNASLEEGASFVLDKLSFVEKVKWADIVITGEGKIDNQTNSLKAPYVVAQIAHRCQKPVYAFAGCADNITDIVFDAVYTLVDNTITKEEAIVNTRELLFQRVLTFANNLK